MSEQKVTFNTVLHRLYAHFSEFEHFNARQAAQALNCTANLASARLTCLAKKGSIEKVSPGVFSLKPGNEPDDEDDVPTTCFIDDEHQAWISSVIDARHARLKTGQWQCH